MADAQRFQQLAHSELHRRGIERSKQVAAVMDGADWQQGFVDYHRSDAIRILDFPHAAQRITGVGQALFGEGTAATHQWIEPRLHQLKHEGPDTILTELRQLQIQHPQSKHIQENLAYLEKRVTQIQYPRFQEQGWPIGSGCVESANKLVVEARLKGAGMHWQRDNVDPMLALRTWRKWIIDQLRELYGAKSSWWKSSPFEKLTQQNIGMHQMNRLSKEMICLLW